MRRSFAYVIGLALIVTTAAGARAQDALDGPARTSVVEALNRQLERGYVFPEVATRMQQDLRARLARGEYDALVRPDDFARTLTEHLQAISHDKHLRVREGPANTGGGGPAGVRSVAGAFGRTERMDGDIAYMEINSFAFPAAVVREATRKAMESAADARALIVDVRRNGGGDPNMVALVSSYLFGDEPVHLNSLYFRPADRTDHFYTDPKVEGHKFGPSKPVFVLASGRTFSAAEEFTYNLQALKRATIVGETTGGGANPGRDVSLPQGLRVFVPTGRAINPITKTNWEGTGVKPDVAVPADSALAIAHRLALEKVGRK
jgi:hypothetical protein